MPAWTVRRFDSDQEYVSYYRAVYSGGLRSVVLWYRLDPTIHNAAKAIASYESSLITPNHAYDKYVKGDTNAMNPHGLVSWGWFDLKHFGCGRLIWV